MNVLVVSPFVPSPDAVGGAPRAIFDRLELLSHRHTVTVVAMRGADEPRTVPRLEELGGRLVTIARATVSPSSSGSLRWRKRARLAIGLVTDRRPMLVQEFGSATACATIQSILRAEAFDVVLIEHALMAQHLSYIRALGTHRVVFTEHDVAAAGAAGIAGADMATFGWLGRMFHAMDRFKWQRYIGSAYRSADTVLVPTEEDARGVMVRAPGANVKVVPFGLVETDLADGVAAAAAVDREPSTLLFVGNFDHAPNRDAALWLCAEIMPRIWRRLDDTTLWLVGSRPTPAIRALESQRVHVYGDVPSVSAYLRAATLFVAPIRDGAGMRMKLLEAMGAGIPVATTSLGARGLDAIPGEDVLIADTADAIADAVLLLLGSPETRDEIGAAGRRLVSSASSRDARAAVLEQALR